MANTIVERAQFSYFYLNSAKSFAARASDFEERERSEGGVLDIPLNRTEHESLVVSSVLLSVAFLEALINEIFADAGDRVVGELESDETEQLKRFWDLGVPKTAKYSVVEKFKLCLAVLRKPELDLGRKHQQDIKHLINLRNALMHFEPVSQAINDDACKKKDTLSELKGLFAEHPKPRGKKFFPSKCLSAGCALWAVKVAGDFADEFCQKLGIHPPYDR
ncbi:MAG: hypothetical protein H6980_02500 [Gammaproteobacteria bacterium]|nr:hypothetical protein [Gammaproteobacteria bacterium]